MGTPANETVQEYAETTEKKEETKIEGNESLEVNPLADFSNKDLITEVSNRMK